MDASVQTMYEVCTNALIEQLRTAHVSDVIVGLSGGIDSAVVTTLAVDVLGPEHVHVYALPGPFSSDHSLKDAYDLARRQGIRCETLHISSAFEACARELSAHTGGTFDGLASENTQARLRMVFLMALSNNSGAWVLNTGNKTEAMVGYSTLYGDTCGAFAPIGCLYKRDVYALARYLNERARLEERVEPIPASILEKAPSAELSAGQTDERSLGMSYETLDSILIRVLEYGEDVASVAEDVRVEESQVRALLHRVDSYAYKRALEPAYPEARLYNIG